MSDHEHQLRRERENATALEENELLQRAVFRDGEVEKLVRQRRIASVPLVQPVLDQVLERLIVSYAISHHVRGAEYGHPECLRVPDLVVVAIPHPPDIRSEGRAVKVYPRHRYEFRPQQVAGVPNSAKLQQARPLPVFLGVHFPELTVETVHAHELLVVSTLKLGGVTTVKLRCLNISGDDAHFVRHVARHEWLADGVHQQQRCGAQQSAPRRRRLHRYRPDVGEAVANHRGNADRDQCCGEYQ